jgi:hypothetical protein
VESPDPVYGPPRTLGEKRLEDILGALLSLLAVQLDMANSLNEFLRSPATKKKG